MPVGMEKDLQIVDAAVGAIREVGDKHEKDNHPDVHNNHPRGSWTDHAPHFYCVGRFRRATGGAGEADEISYLNRVKRESARPLTSEVSD